jgi:hypothetical protein
MTEIWTPKSDPDDWGAVQEIESSDRLRTLPDGRVMRESQITLSPEAMRQMLEGYRCARCLEYEGIVPLGAFPEACPLCKFPMRAEQQRQLAQDYVGERPELPAGFPLQREREYLERKFYEKKGYVSPGKEL